MDVFQVVKALRVQKPGAVHTVVSLASQHTVSSVCVLYIINPRRVCAARVTVVVLCVCMYLCVYVCMCVHSYLPPHTLESQKRDTKLILRNTGIVLNFADFPKNASFKSYGVICLPRAAPAS